MDGGVAEGLIADGGARSATMRLCLRACVAVLVLLATLPLSAAPREVPGLQRDIAFDAYSALATSAELMRRQLTPLEASDVQAYSARTAQTVDTYGLDLRNERFTVYVPPPHDAQRAYGLLVFIPPWPQAAVPKAWLPVLDELGLIFVTAADSGNDAAIVGRRVALAVHAYANVMRRYRVDPERVYVGGLSGGSRVALRTAIAYPDVFRGAFLDAGSDPLGRPGFPIPPADLFALAQESTRLVYVTGTRDEAARDMERVSMQSMRRWCVFDVRSQPLIEVAHELAGARAFAQALRALEAPPQPQPELAACRQRVADDLARELAVVRERLAAGDADGARRTLREIDVGYGGLAAPASLDLAGKLAGDATRGAP